MTQYYSNILCLVSIKIESISIKVKIDRNLSKFNIFLKYRHITYVCSYSTMGSQKEDVNLTTRKKLY